MTPSIAPVLIQVEENPNCDRWDGQVFQPRTAPRAVSDVRVERAGKSVWCAITGLDEGEPIPAMACVVDDSGDGACWLVFGGTWGLRLTDDAGKQWGEPYMLLPADGADLRFLRGAS